MKNIISIFLILFLAAPLLAYSAGEIDAEDKYAWGSHVGWINFGADHGSVQVTDSEVLGHAWVDSHGWLDLQPDIHGVRNDGEGNLSGHAWGAHTGYINFEGVTIDEEGYFHGYAEGAVTGTVNFNCSNVLLGCLSSDFRVRTSWRPATEEEKFGEESGDSSGSAGGGGNPRRNKIAETIDENFPIFRETADAFAIMFELPTAKNKGQAAAAFSAFSGKIKLTEIPSPIGEAPPESAGSYSLTVYFFLILLFIFLIYRKLKNNFW